MSDDKFDEQLFEAVLDDMSIHSFEDNSLLQKKSDTPPDTLYILPLSRRPFFPGMAAPLLIEPGPFYEVLKIVAKSQHKYIGLILTKNEQVDVYKTKLADLCDVGVLARILRITPVEKGGAQVVLSMEKRFTIKSAVPKSKILKAHVLFHEDTPLLSQEIKAYSISIISTIKELLKLNPLFKEELQIFLGHSDFTEPGKLADFAVALTTASREELQEVLSTLDIRERINKALVLLKNELDISILQNTIKSKIESNISKSQKEFLLKEQLKTIKKELGIERSDKSVDRDKFEARLKELTIPEDVSKVINEELEKLNALDMQSAEYNVSRSYLEWLTTIPWGITSEECHNLADAAKILEADHYGLKDIKERILEFIGVGQLTGSIKGSIICLVGPPGVGKTSIGKSIARALKRKFYRFSVGGMKDEAEIKGHRRTYVSAMPGKIIQALKYCKSMNPVIMLDEVDKMGKGYQGDPASALLEVLDPEQNSDFLDHYLDVRCDLSQVLFIVTANVLDTIPEPLKDRMDILRLSGYIMQEKLEIAKKYLIPRHLKEMGLKKSQVSFTAPALKEMINGYAREAGVRHLEQVIKKILRKLVVKIIQKEQLTENNSPNKQLVKDKYLIDLESLKEFLGKPIFTTDRFYETTPVGVCTGLAWTAMGGATLYIESIKVPGEKTTMKLTGQAGDVMKESSEIAWSYLHSALNRYAPKSLFFKKMHVHIHIPEGATPKDGPSAGVTIATSLLSLLTNRPVLDNLGMTGELTLTGCVLPIGGLKEKIVAARRSGLKTLIFPKDNLRDYEELPEYIRKGIVVHFVEHYDEIFKIAFPLNNH